MAPVPKKLMSEKTSIRYIDEVQRGPEASARLAVRTKTP